MGSWLGCCGLGSIGTVLMAGGAVFYETGLVAGCQAIKVDVIYAGWRNSIARLVAPLAEIVVPTGVSLRIVLVMVKGEDLGTSGAVVFCLFV